VNTDTVAGVVGVLLTAVGRNATAEDLETWNLALKPYDDEEAAREALELHLRQATRFVTPAEFIETYKAVAKRRLDARSLPKAREEWAPPTEEEKADRLAALADLRQSLRGSSQPA